MINVIFVMNKIKHKKFIATAVLITMKSASTCLVNYKSEMGIKPVRKDTLYESNLKKWT